MTRRIALASCAAGVLLLFPLAASSAGCPSPNPKYPVPTHVSPEAQAVLAQPVDSSNAEAPLPTTPAEWKAWRAAIEARFLPMLEPAAARAQVRIAKSELGGVTVRELVPAAPREPRAGRVLMNVHGGAYTMNGGDLSVLGGLRLAASGYRVVAVDYRMPPDHPFPAAVEDGVAVYRELVKTSPPSGIAIFGSSAGGGLAAAVTLAARDEGLPLPGAVVMHTPWTDLAGNSDSYFTNECVDPVLSMYDGMIAASARVYAGATDLKHPLVSPVYADYSKGFPPAFLSTGTRDLLLSDTVRLHRELRRAGVPADLHVFEALWHGIMQLPVEGQELHAETLAFLEKNLSD